MPLICYYKCNFTFHAACTFLTYFTICKCGFCGIWRTSTWNCFSFRPFLYVGVAPAYEYGFWAVLVLEIDLLANTILTRLSPAACGLIVCKSVLRNRPCSPAGGISAASCLVRSTNWAIMKRAQRNHKSLFKIFTLKSSANLVTTRLTPHSLFMNASSFRQDHWPRRCSFHLKMFCDHSRSHISTANVDPRRESMMLIF